MAKLTDDDVVARLTYAAAQAVGFSDSKLSKERERVRLAYEGERPEKVSPSDSSYVSLDVYDAVEAMKAQLMEAALSTHRPVSFQPGPGETEDQAGARTDWCDHVIWDKNKGFSILATAIDDGLMARAGILKVYWETAEKTEEYDLTDVAYADLEAHIGDNPDHEIEDYEVHEDGQTLKRVRLSKKVDRSQVRLEPLPPEEFGISPMADSIQGAEVVFHRRRMTISQLLKAGYDKSVVMSLQDDERLWEGTDSDRYGRFQQTDDMIGEDVTSDMAKARHRCMVVEAYTELDLDDSGESRLFKVTYVGSTVLDKEPVERKPFIAFVPLPRSHAFWGSNYAKQVLQTQTARTYLTRSIINHALVTNNPRQMVVRGAVVNPRELMDNRLGGIVNVTRPDGIVPLPQAGLNPYVFQTLQMLDENKEQLTGISKLSQGLNKDAISSQNSQGMVNDLINVSQTRQKVIVRNWCECFLRPLYTMVYQLTLENEDRAKLAQVGGAWQELDFTSWPQDSEAVVNVTLGPDAQKQEVTKWVVFDKMMSADPDLKRFYPDAKRFAVIKRAMLASGVRDWQNYILTPDQVPPPQPTPMMLADLEVKKADAAVKRANAQAAVDSLRVKQQLAQVKHTETEAKISLSAQKESDHTDLEVQKFHHDVAMDAANLRMEAAAQAQGALKASVASSSSN